MKIRFTVPESSAGVQLGTFLRKQGVSLSQVRSLKRVENGIVLNGLPAKTNCLLRAGDKIQLSPREAEVFSARPENIALDVVYHSQHALVVNKPAGMVMHPGPGYHSGTLANAVCGFYAAQGQTAAFRPVGRLDGDTSGLVLCAANAASAALLSNSVQKTYIALVSGEMSGEGALRFPLGPKPGSAVMQQVMAAGKECLTNYWVLGSAQGASLLRVQLGTGRTHQIRAHFAHIGHPLLGDYLYQGPQQYITRHALHSAQISFRELSGNCPRLISPLPGDMRAAVCLLGLQEAAARQGVF